MLAGSVPKIVARIADEHYRQFTSRKVFVACSGSFTVERHLASIGGWSEMHSNDVLLVSEVLGRWAEGNPMRLTLSDLGRERVPWLQPYLDDEDPSGRVATVACMAQFAMMARAKEDASPFYATMLRETQRQFPQMHAKVAEQIRQAPLHVDSYFSGDVFEYLDRTTPDDAVVSYPPFGGPRDAASRYATDYVKLHPLFEWEEPKYTLLHDAELDALYARIADRRDWFFAVNRRLPQFEDNYRGRVQTSNRGTTFYVYGSGGPTRIVTPKQHVAAFQMPHIGPEDEIGEKIALHHLDGTQFALLRSSYMNHGIRPGSPDLMVGVSVDGLLVGAFAYSFAPTYAVWDKYLPGPSAYLMSDFPVAHSKYDRLAKLIVLASVSAEATALVHRVGKKPFRSMTTTAFSKNPVSMKYRGVLDLLRRKDNDVLAHAAFADKIKDDPYYQRPYDLQYGTLLGQHTLDEALAIWKRKHGHVLKKEPVG